VKHHLVAVVVLCVVSWAAAVALAVAVIHP